MNDMDTVMCENCHEEIQGEVQWTDDDIPLCRECMAKCWDEPTTGISSKVALRLVPR